MAGVRLSADEAWDLLAATHTGILTTLRRDGVPIALPLWFVALDRRIYVSTPAGAKKVARVRHDSRASFLVESGEAWIDLVAVHLTGRVSLVDDETLDARVQAALDAKYSSYRLADDAMPVATRSHYATARAVIEFVPDDRFISWENRRLFG